MNTRTGVLQTRIIRDTYFDSLLLLVATQVMSDRPGVDWAGAVMATPSGKEQLDADGFGEELLDGASASDLVLAVRGTDDAAAEEALDAGLAATASERAADEGNGTSVQAPRTVAEAVETLASASVAIISVPGDYAALEAHHALTANLHVLLFSDNVPLAEEVELKQRANELGLLVMGPGAGTSILAGIGLGFSNAVRRGPVGVIAAAGTGAQEVSALLDRWGVGVSHVIGVGGRDLSEAVQGRTTKAAIRALESDPETKVILLVSKPPEASVAHDVLRLCENTPTVVTFLGLNTMASTANIHMTATLEAGAKEAARLAGNSPPATAVGLREKVEAACARLGDARRLIRGYFSGGTLCYEAQLIIGEHLGDTYSNEPLNRDHGMPAPDGAHVLLDLGAEEYTHGRPHPMIDPSARLDMMTAEVGDDSVAVVLIDVVLGYGAHDDPAGQLAPVCKEIMADGGPQVVAYVLGTDSDPQNYARQREILEDAGCLVTDTAARAALAAAAIAGRRPDLVNEGS